ncbi:MAG: GNAT family N-acetyltransferase [Alphaproteobacteria bacterium]|nr:GNAT family N-acetyltransferase [Alphaproteobacteria bacterium]
MAHVLDNPVWSALTGRQAGIALGSDRARRYLPDISPWAALADDTPEALDELATLVPADGSVFLVRKADQPFAATGRLSATPFLGLQMVATNVTAPDHSDEVVDLGDGDAPEMIDLAALTRPGPFIARTHSLGDFVGIRKGGKLVAMAGERFKVDGFTEVSGVCTHPDWRGRGYAALLSRVVAARIMARGETPMLHAFIANTAAIRLYEQLGFTARSQLHGVVFRRA